MCEEDRFLKACAACDWECSPSANRNVSQQKFFVLSYWEKAELYLHRQSSWPQPSPYGGKKKNMAFIKHCRKREAFFLRSILKNRCTLAVMGKNWDALPEPMVMNDEWLTFFFFYFYNSEMATQTARVLYMYTLWRLNSINKCESWHSAQKGGTNAISNILLLVATVTLWSIWCVHFDACDS